MMKYRLKTTEALKQLRADQNGVVSFEYIVVAACIVATVILVFKGTGANTVGAALVTGLGHITTAISGI